MRPRKWIVLLTPVVMMCLFAGDDSIAAPRSRRPVLHVAAFGAWECQGTLIVGVNLETLAGTHWAAKSDDGLEDVQVHESGSAGRWVSVHSVSGGEGYRRWPGLATTRMDLDGTVRVIRTDGTGITSTPQFLAAGKC